MTLNMLQPRELEQIEEKLRPYLVPHTFDEATQEIEGLIEELVEQRRKKDAKNVRLTDKDWYKKIQTITDPYLIDVLISQLEARGEQLEPGYLKSRERPRTRKSIPVSLWLCGICNKSHDTQAKADACCRNGNGKRE